VTTSINAARIPNNCGIRPVRLTRNSSRGHQRKRPVIADRPFSISVSLLAGHPLHLNSMMSPSFHHVSCSFRTKQPAAFTACSALVLQQINAKGPRTSLRRGPGGNKRGGPDHPARRSLFVFVLLQRQDIPTRYRPSASCSIQRTMSRLDDSGIDVMSVTICQRSGDC